VVISIAVKNTKTRQSRKNASMKVRYGTLGKLSEMEKEKAMTVRMVVTEIYTWLFRSRVSIQYTVHDSATINSNGKKIFQT
jgi:hypothetical protein